MQPTDCWKHKRHVDDQSEASTVLLAYCNRLARKQQYAMSLPCENSTMKTGKKFLKIRLCIRMSGTALGENKMVIPKRRILVKCRPRNICFTAQHTVLIT